MRALWSFERFAAGDSRLDYNGLVTFKCLKHSIVLQSWAWTRLPEYHVAQRRSKFHIRPNLDDLDMQYVFARDRRSLTQAEFFQEGHNDTTLLALQKL